MPDPDDPPSPAEYAVHELIEAADSMVDWFAGNEPSRLKRPGFVRLVAATEHARAALDAGLCAAEG